MISADRVLSSLGVDVVAEMSNLHSQTTLEERAGLYYLAKVLYTGEGEIWDIGCAAGGSSYCLAAGLRDSDGQINAPEIQAFDLFDGYSIGSFNDAFKRCRNDIDAFNDQTHKVQKYLQPVQMDLASSFQSYRSEAKIEVAHIDAAKSLPLWTSIFRRLVASVIPGKTIWVFQDFERARLPWQIYGISALLSFGEFIGGARDGTLYFKFRSKVPSDTVIKICSDGFTLDEKIVGVKAVLDIVKSDLADLFSSPKVDLSDVEKTVKAYIYFWSGDYRRAKQLLGFVSDEFLSYPQNRIYASEICSGRQDKLFV